MQADLSGTNLVRISSGHWPDFLVPQAFSWAMSQDARLGKTDARKPSSQAGRRWFESGLPLQQPPSRVVARSPIVKAENSPDS